VRCFRHNYQRGPLGLPIATPANESDHKRKIVTEVVYVTETVADVVVYVDATGLPYSRSTSEKVTSVTTSVVSTSAVAPSTTAESLQAPVSSATSAPAPSSSSPTLVISVVEPTSVAIQETTPKPTPESSTVTPPQSSAAPDVPAHIADAGSLPLGVAWDAYTDSAHCKSTEEIASDFSRMKDYKIIRIYGTDCDQVPLAVQNALKNGQKVSIRLPCDCAITDLT
jgi:hypothetical protein